MRKPIIEPYASSGEAVYSSQGMLIPASYSAEVHDLSSARLPLSVLGNTPYADALVFDGDQDLGLLEDTGLSCGACVGLGDFRAPEGDVNPKTTGSFKKELREVIEAATEPGTERNRQVGLRLLAKADQISNLMEKRAAVTEDIRTGYREQARSAEAWDRKTLRDIKANIDPDVTPSKQTILRIAADRKKAFEAARMGVRLQKANIAASALTANALEQTTLLQRMATSVAMGKPSLAAVYGGMYDKVARASDGLKQIRKEQIQKDHKMGLEGLSTTDPHLVDLMGADDAEAELAAQQYVELAFLEGFADVPLDDPNSGLDGLEDLAWGRFRKRIKKAARKVKSRVKTVAKKIKNSKVVKNTIKVAKPIARAVKKSIQATVIAPVKSTVHGARAIARGKSVKTAFKSAAKVMKKAGKQLGQSIGSLTVGLSCALEDTRLGRAAAQYVGQAVGTVYGGGTAGGAVGKEVGRKANEMNRSACKGLEKSGFSGKGNFKGFKAAGRNMRNVGRDLRKNVFSKEAMLASAMRIAGNMMGGGYVPMKVPGTDKLMSMATDKAMSAAKGYAIKKGRGIARKVGANLTKKVLGKKAAAVVNRASTYARAAIGKGGGEAARAIARDLGPVAGNKLLRRAGVNPRMANQISGAGRALAQARRGKTLKLDVNTARALVQKLGPVGAQQVAMRAGMSPRASKALLEVAQRGGSLNKTQLNRAMVQRMLREKALGAGRRRARKATARYGKRRVRKAAAARMRRSAPSWLRRAAA
jgi:hypothetical protein